MSTSFLSINDLHLGGCLKSSPSNVAQQVSRESPDMTAQERTRSRSPILSLGHDAEILVFLTSHVFGSPSQHARRSSCSCFSDVSRTSPGTVKWYLLGYLSLGYLATESPSLEFSLSPFRSTPSPLSLGFSTSTVFFSKSPRPCFRHETLCVGNVPPSPPLELLGLCHSGCYSGEASPSEEGPH